MGYGRDAVRALFHGVMRLFAGTRLALPVLERAAVVPVVWKSRLFARTLGAMAEYHQGRAALIETNLGIVDWLRALIPAGKSDLIFSKLTSVLADTNFLVTPAVIPVMAA